MNETEMSRVPAYIASKIPQRNKRKQHGCIGAHCLESFSAKKTLRNSNFHGNLQVKFDQT